MLHTGSAAAQLSLYDVGGAGPSFIIRDDDIDSIRVIYDSDIHCV